MLQATHSERLAPRLWYALLDLLFPPRCVGCGRVDHLLCPDCRRSIEKLKDPRCPLCARPVAASKNASPSERKSACTLCSRQPLRLDGTTSAAVFDGVMRQAVHALKYRGCTQLASPLAEFLVDAWNRAGYDADFIIPVPLHPRRLKERGYNQSILLATEFARRVDMPVRTDMLVRTRRTEAQTQLGAAERRSNVAGAFATRGSAVSGHSVLLIDDVCTTGSTLQACADALRDAGAKRVFGLTLSRAWWNPETGKMSDAHSAFDHI